MTDMPETSRKQVKRSKWLFGAGLLLILTLLTMYCCRPSLAQLEFSSGAWKSASTEERGRMARSLLGQGLLEGLSREEVRSLLGPPDAEGKLMFYKLGYMGRNSRIPFTFPYRLMISFDESDCVSRAVVRD